jgi:hypothetical protein
LLLFFSLAYAFTWAGFAVAADALAAMAQDRPVPSTLRLVIGILAPFGPTFAALLLTAMSSGRAGLRLLGARILRWRAPFGLYAVVLLWVLAIRLAGLALHAGATGSIPVLLNLGHWHLALPRFFLILLLGGPLGEEIGWRGFALPQLEAAFGPLRASLVLGIVWGLWHLPVFFIPGLDQYGQPLLPYLAMVTAYSFVFTFVSNRSGGSLWLALIHHAAINTTLWLVATTPRPEAWRLWSFDMPAPWLISLALAWLFVAVLIAKGAFSRPSPLPT